MIPISSPVRWTPSSSPAPEKRLLTVSEERGYLASEVKYISAEELFSSTRFGI